MIDLLNIVIVNWNSGPHIKACIDSIIRNSHGLVTRTIVVDNGSIDGSIATIENCPSVTLINTGTNLGFGKACNLGAHFADSQYLLFLNPDAALYAETLSTTIAYMQEPANAKVGICGVQLLDEAAQVSRHCARFPAATDFVAHSIGLDRFFPRIGHVMAEWDHLQTQKVDHVIGAFFLVRRELFDALHGFDERFFVYLEDLDFSYRAHKAGWSSVYLTAAQAFHVGGGSSKQVKARRLFYSMSSHFLYAFKHFSRIGAFAVLMSTLIVEPACRSAQALLHFSWPTLKETWAAYGLLWRWLPQWALKKDTR